jgi:hypothetical protein
MNILSIFAKSEPTPATPATPVVEDPEQVLLEQLTAANVALDLHAEAMNTFRSRNFATIDSRVMVRGESVSDAAQLRSQWDRLLRELTLLQQRRSAILKAWSEIPKTR